MPEHDWERIRQAKDAYRDRMAALPFDEKLRLLERLRERTLEVAGLASTGKQRVGATNTRLIDVKATQVGQNASSVANASYFGARATLVAAIAAMTHSQTSTLTTPDPKRR
jgi:uncharacterized protein YaaQ